jgi:hypothetical protein
MKLVPPRIRRVEPDGFAPGPSVREADVPRVHVIVTPPVPVTDVATFATMGSYVPKAMEEVEIWQLLETVTETPRVAVALAAARGPARRSVAVPAATAMSFFMVSVPCGVSSPCLPPARFTVERRPRTGAIRGGASREKVFFRS